MNRFIAELGKIDEQQNKSGESSPSSATSNDKNRSAPQIPSAPGQESYAEVAAEPPSRGTAYSAIVNDRTGLSERKGASQGRSTASAGGKSQSGPGQESYAEAAAEEPHANESVVREDRVGYTETR